MQQTRYLALDGLRGFVAVAIVIHHFTQHSAGHHEFFASAAIGVELFFCLGGFVIAHSYHQRLLDGMPFREYANKRLIRLYPMYLAGLIAGLVVMALLKLRGMTDYSWQALGLGAALNAFYLPYLNEGSFRLFVDEMPGVIFPFNGPAWSLFFGLLANFSYALAIRYSRWLPASIAVGSAVALYEVTRRMGEAQGWGTENFLGGFPRVFYSFFTGVLIYQWRDRLAFLPRVSLWWLLLAVAAMLLIPRFASHKFYWFVCAIFAVPMLVAFGARAVVPETPRWLAFCSHSARISYPIYCMHFPLLVLAGSFVSTEKFLPALTVLFVLAAIGFAELTQRAIERPLRDLLRSVRRS